MTKSLLKKIAYLIFVIIWMLLVFMFSSENGSKSQETSKTVTKTIVKILTYNQDLTEEQQNILINKLDYIVRKIAHFSIYAIGGVLIYNYINLYNIKVNKKIIISILIGGIYALFDEFHQYFISDRSAQILDVCIDIFGVLTGVALIYLIKKLKKTLSC